MALVIRTLSDQLVGLVRDRIVSGQVAPDSPIRQDALASELGISKIPLREALTRLEQEGLVHSRRNRGFFVSGLSTREAEEVYALRLKLEPDAVAMASERATAEQRDAARQALALLEERSGAGGGSVGARNRAFHLALLRPSGQTITVNILERLHVLSERYAHKHLEPLGRLQRANTEHQEMIQAWLDRDLKRLRSITVAHIATTLDDLRQQLGEDS